MSVHSHHHHLNGQHYQYREGQCQTVITNDTQHFSSNNLHKKERDKKRKQLDLDGGKRSMGLHSSAAA